jgi:hydrogenase-4 component E
VFKGLIIPISLRRMIVQLGIHREIENGRGHRPHHARRHGAVALSMVVMLRVTPTPIRWRARISPSRCRWCCSAS